MRRILISIGFILVCVGLAIWIFRGPISLRIMERALAMNLSADPIAELPDGLHVRLCGAGGPLFDPNRSAPCVAIIAGRSLYLVDAGSGAARNLAAVGLQAGDIDGVFLTHFHSDHIDGLGELGMLRWIAGNHRMPLPLYGAEGVEGIVEGLNRAYRLDSVYRTTHHGPRVAPPTGSGFRAMPFPEPANGDAKVVLEKDGLRVMTFRVDHSPVVPAVGYRFEYGGRSIVLSGDTKKSANVERFSKGADLLIHEALSPELMDVIRRAAESTGNANVAKIAVDVLDYHTTPVEAAQIAEAAGVGHLLYAHVVPPMPIPGLRSVFMRGVHEAYGGPITLGRDGTAISLPVGSAEILVDGG